MVGQSRELQTGGIAPTLDDAELLFEEEIEELSVAELPASARSTNSSENWQQGRKAEFTGVAPDELL